MIVIHIRAAFIVSLFLLSSVAAIAQDIQPIPDLQRRVMDLSGLLRDEETRMLESKLAQFEQRKGSQIAVLLVNTTQPETIEQFGIRVADAWKLGREGVDDGILLLVAIQDRRLRIEVGYGLEGAVPDAYSKRIIEQIIKPSFQQGQFYLGIDQGIDALIALVDGEALPEPRASGAMDAGSVGVWKILLPVFLLFGALSLNGVLKPVLGKVGSRISIFLGTFGIGWILISFAFGLIVSLITLFILANPSSGSGHHRRGPFFPGSFGGGRGGYGGGFGGGFGGGGGGFGGGGASGGW